ncbi:MAG: App1 family protein [Mycetocola reblochoni]|nr:phosphatase domain-containing protein [Mycetocola reblochoni]
MPESPSPVPRGPLHRAARIDYAFQDWRAARAARRGAVPMPIGFIGYGSTGWVRVLARVLMTPEGEQPPERAAQRARGWRSFLAIPVNAATVIVTINGVDHEVTADRGGVVDVVVEAELEPGWSTIQLRCPGGPRVPAPVFIVDPATRFGIVSDVDDTVMVTVLPRPFVAAWNTFVRDEHARLPVPGMAVFLERMVRDNPGAPVIYLSTGAWNVAPTLTRFIERHLYPSGPLLLTDWGPTHDRVFRSGRAHKQDNLSRLAAEFPHIRWLLVGDDGQHDVELYDSFAEANPGHVAAIAIRRLSAGQAMLAGGRTKSDHGTGPRWYSAPDGSGLLRQIEADGLDGGRST